MDEAGLPEGEESVEAATGESYTPEGGLHNGVKSEDSFEVVEIYWFELYIFELVEAFDLGDILVEIVDEGGLFDQKCSIE